MKVRRGYGTRIVFCNYLMSGRVVFEDVVEAYYKQTNEMFGTDYEAPK